MSFLFAFVLLQSGQLSVSEALGIALLTILAGAVTHIVIGSLNAREFKGSIAAKVNTKFQALDIEIEQLKESDRDLWKANSARRTEITEVREKVATIEGRLDAGHARGHGAGSL
jgi:chitinase